MYRVSTCFNQPLGGAGFRWPIHNRIGRSAPKTQRDPKVGGGGYDHGPPPHVLGGAKKIALVMLGCRNLEIDSQVPKLEDAKALGYNELCDLS